MSSSRHPTEPELLVERGGRPALGVRSTLGGTALSHIRQHIDELYERNAFLLATAYYGDLAPDEKHLFREDILRLFRAGGGGQDGGARPAAQAADEGDAIGARAWG